MTSARAVTVTLAEIARLAGVGRAAVSNWRRRYESFPARAGGTDVSPRFSLTEIETWLRDNGKLKDAAGREWLWPRFEALGGRDATGLAIAAVGDRMSGAVGSGGKVARPTRAEEPAGLSNQACELVGRAIELGQRAGRTETFEFLLRRWLEVNVRQISTTPEPLAALMVEVARRVRRTARTGAASGTENTQADEEDGALVVLDPACGTGHLLAAAAAGSPVTLLGCDRDPVLARLAGARLALLPRPGDAEGVVRVEAADSLRADAFADTQADLVLCNPPFNERDWGYGELATDARWTHGMPPRTEPELAWVQHCLSRLRPGGAAVVVLPPAVAARRAGRRIRGSLLRTGLLRAVVALPPGCAAPHSVSLHLWVLRRPADGETAWGSGELLLADGAARFPRTASRDPAPDWEALGAFVVSAIDAIGPQDSDDDRSRRPSERALPAHMASVPLVDLLDEAVDLTPGCHITPEPSGIGPRLDASWSEFGTLLRDLEDAGKHLAALDLTGSGPDAQPTTTVGELARAGALTLRGGQQPARGTVREGQPADDGVPLLTVPDLLLDGEPRGWMFRTDAESAGAAVAEPGDVVVAGVARAFSAWVHDGPPTALGPQLYALRVHPEHLDAWFLAGCLRARANARQAGTHASSSSRVDVRKLRVRQVRPDQQRQYSETFRQVVALEGLVARLNTVGNGLVRDISDELVR